MNSLLKLIGLGVVVVIGGLSYLSSKRKRELMDDNSEEEKGDSKSSVEESLKNFKLDFSSLDNKSFMKIETLDLPKVVKWFKDRVDLLKNAKTNYKAILVDVNVLSLTKVPFADTDKEGFEQVYIQGLFDTNSNTMTEEIRVIFTNHLTEDLFDLFDGKSIIEFK